MEKLSLNPQCMLCILNRYLNNTPGNADDNTSLKYTKNVLNIIANAEKDVTAPEVVAAITSLKNKTFGYSDDFGDLKPYFNKLMLSFENEFENNINNSYDPLFTAIRYAMLGNYIDFGAMNSVDESRLSSIPEDAEKINIDIKEYNNFKNDLASAKSLIYLTDNCGEIVTDKILIKQIKNKYPKLNIEVFVRGEPVLNDATIEDAKEVGLTDIVTVTPNGTNIAGTSLKKLPKELLEKINNADIIISKGQGNFETLNHSNKNIYYMFLCKCNYFSEQFGVPKYTGMFLNDLRMG